MALWYFQDLHLTKTNHLFLVSLFLLSLVLLFIRNTAKSRAKSNFPSSPPRLPIIGNLHQLGTFPHRSLAALSDKYGPLMLLQLGQSPTLVVSSSEMYKEITKNHDIAFSDRPQMTATNILFYRCEDVGFTPYGEYWRQARKLIVLEILSLKRVQQFQFVRDEEVARLVDKARKVSLAGESLDLSKMLIGTSNNIVSRCIFGQRFEEETGRSMFGELSRKLLRQLVAFSVADFFPSLRWIDVARGFIARLNAISREFDSFFDKVIEEHERRDIGGSDVKDFLDILLRLKRDGMLDFDLSPNRLKGILTDLFVGGSDTTSTSLEWLMAELIKNSRVMKKAQEEVRRVVGIKRKISMDDINGMDYLKCVIKENLRLHPPLPLLVARKTSASVEVGGYKVPANANVFVNSWKIHRSSSLWDRPEEFLPERFQNNPLDFKLGQDFDFVPFGSGRRGCPGLLFGIASIEFVIANLLYWFDWKLASDAGLPEDLDMSEVNGLTVQKKVPLNLVPIFHSPA